jgi:hypothetical protein
VVWIEFDISGARKHALDHVPGLRHDVGHGSGGQTLVRREQQSFKNERSGW